MGDYKQAYNEEQFMYIFSFSVILNEVLYMQNSLNGEESIKFRIFWLIIEQHEKTFRSFLSILNRFELIKPKNRLKV